jgi:toxin-antitoxin system PIN domain toxin
MLVDANLLLYASSRRDPQHEVAREWLERALNGSTRVGLPWQSLTAFLRVSTNPRVFEAPLTPERACDQVAEWLAAPSVWVPSPTERHAEVLSDLVRRYRVVGPLVSDAVLAALAVEHGVSIASTDSDFARFREIRWENPLAS